jgi:hypothetical protein
MADETSDPLLDLSERRRKEREAVDEGGGGQSEGFELAEQELIEHSSHGDGHSPAKISRDAYGEGDSEQTSEDAEDEYGEADEEHLTD